MDIQRYLNLVTSQHQDKPKFMAWLTSPLSILDDAVTLSNSFYSYFDIDLAIGAQLDIIGKIIGVSRTVTFQPTPFCSLGVPGVPYFSYPSPVLDDDMYRLVLRAKILQNMWDGTLPSLYEMWDTLLPNARLVIRDNQDMTIIALVIGLSMQIQKDLISNGYIVPKPQGVQMSFIYSAEPIFAYDLDSEEFKGYGEGYWAKYDL